MRKRLTAVALAGTVGLGAVGAVTYPALAESGSSRPGSEATKDPNAESRTSAIRDALKGLVDDKTLTADQADKVASTLGESKALPGGGGLRRGGGGLLGVEGPQADEAAAKVLGLSVNDLRTALRDGSTLADLAKKHGKDVDTLVSALVQVAKDRLDEGVKAGRITQDMATQIEKTLDQRVRTVVQNGRPTWAMGGGRRAHDGNARPGPGTAPGTDGESGQGGQSGTPAPSEQGSASSTSFSNA